jgi:hypothetical protein
MASKKLPVEPEQKTFKAEIEMGATWKKLSR